MTNKDRNKLENVADQLQKDGFPEELQQQWVIYNGWAGRCRPSTGQHEIRSYIQFIRIAEEKWYSHLTSGAKTNFKEMGLIQLSVCVYTGKTGNMVV